MGATEAILGTIEQGLILLNKIVPDEATKIANKIKEHREKWDVEYAKGPVRDDNMLDLIDIELRDIRELFFGAIKIAASKIDSRS